MKAVWDSCKAADIEIPENVEKFFDWEEPDDAGVEVDLEKLPECCTEWKAEMREGFEVDIASIPPHIKKIRFYNAY